MDLGLVGKRALVCASTQGLGYACARSLAREGVAVTLNGRDAERLAAARIRLEGECGVGVSDLWNRNGTHRCGAVNGNCDRNVEIIDNPIAIQILESEVRHQNDGPVSEGVDDSVRRVMLELAANF